MAGSSMVPIGAEEGWEDNADVQEESVINRELPRLFPRLKAGPLLCCYSWCPGMFLP